MELLLVLIICFLVLGLNCVIFVVGALATPKGSIYLGTVHWPGDYFSYLSQMAQGKYSFFLVRVLHTAEDLPPTIVGWQMVWLGKFFSLLGIDNIYGYQIALVVFIFFFLILTYRLMIFIFPVSLSCRSKERGKRLLAFFFFATSTAFFKVGLDNGKLVWSIYDYWYNTGNSLVRFPHTPHHAIADNLAVLMMLNTIYWIKRNLNIAKKTIVIAVATLGGAAICSITPVHWMLVGLGAGVAISIYEAILAIRRRIVLRVFFERTIKSLTPVIFYVLGGLPVFFYLKKVYESSSSNLFSWEGYQQLPASFYLIFVGSGLVIPLAISGVWNFIKKADFPRIFGISFILVCSLFFFSFIPVSLHITNARFWPGTIYIFIAALAAEGIYFLAGFFGRYKKLALSVLIIIYTASVLPTHIIDLIEKSKPKLGNAYYYLPKDIYASYLTAEKISSKDDLFLVQWPMNLSFPGITGRRTFHGYDPTTLDFATKDKEAYDFFAGNLSEREMGALLDKYSINYVLGYWWNPKLPQFARLKRVYSNSIIAIDKVVR